MSLLLLFGGSSNAQTITPAAIGSTVSFGTATITPGPVEIDPTAIGSTVSFGTATASNTVEIDPTGIASTVTFGAATVTPGEIVVTPDPIGSTVAFGDVTIAGGVQTITGGGRLPLPLTLRHPEPKPQPARRQTIWAEPAYLTVTFGPVAVIRHAQPAALATPTDEELLLLV